jgi:serine phosphatase RsbU (regulator of sigma subunit)
VPAGLAERLAVQIDALPEGFSLLSRSGSTREMARRLFQILRGSLTTLDGHVFLRPTGGAWEHLHGGTPAPESLLPEAPPLTGCAVEDPDHPPYRLRGIQLLPDGALAVVILGRKLSPRSPYTDPDRLTFRIYLQLFASAYQAFLGRRKEKDLGFHLQHRLLQLTSLIDTGMDLARPQPEEELYTRALERATALTNAARGSIRTGSGSVLRRFLSFPPGTTLRRGLPESHRISASFTFGGRRAVFELQEKESRAGTVPFEETDRVLLDALARQVHAALEVRHLHAQEVEKQRIERDMTVAGAIQKRILPETLPAIPGYDLAGVNIPTKLVGGDYYDCIPVSGGRFALVMADVAGKGIPAALLVSSFHAYLAAYLERDVPLDELATLLNGAIYRASTEERYITAIIALLTPGTGVLECINAGHTALTLVRTDGSVVEHEAGGLALGLFEEAFPLERVTVELRPGDRLFVYTDGVSEAMNPGRQLYDTDGRLRAFAAATRPAGAREFIDALQADITSFVAGAPQADDITALYLIRNP